MNIWQLLLASMKEEPRKWLAAAGSALLAILLGFVLLSDEVSYILFSRLGYWMLLLLLLLTAVPLWVVLKRALTEIRWSRLELVGLAAALLGGAFLQVHEPDDWQIITDDLTGCSAAMGMHMTRMPLTLNNGMWEDGRFHLKVLGVDKRSLMFSLVLATVHDLTDYRLENGFWLNALLGYAFCVVLYLLGRELGGVGGGVLAVLLAVSLPLLHIQANGSGHDLLNLTALVTLLLVCWRYFRDGSQMAALAAFWLGVSMVYLRAESFLYLLLPLGVWLMRWLQEGRVRLPWVVLLAPLLLMPRVWQAELTSNTIGLVSEDKLETGVHGFFSPLYWWPNMQSAWEFFTSPAEQYPNNPLLFLIGLVAVAYLYFRRKEVACTEQTRRFFILCGLVAGAHLLFMWTMLIGDFARVTVMRYSLPFYVYLILGVVVAYRFAARQERARPVLWAVSLLSLLAVASPSLASRHYAAHYYPRQVWHTFRESLMREEYRRALFVTSRPLAAGLCERAAIDSDRLPYLAEQLEAHRQLGTFSEILFLQRMHLAADGSWFAVEPIPENYILEPVEVHPLKPLSGLAISRLVRVEGTEFTLGHIIPENPVGGFKYEDALEAMEAYALW